MLRWIQGKVARSLKWFSQGLLLFLFHLLEPLKTSNLHYCLGVLVIAVFSVLWATHGKNIPILTATCNVSCTGCSVFYILTEMYRSQMGGWVENCFSFPFSPRTLHLALPFHCSAPIVKNRVWSTNSKKALGGTRLKQNWENRKGHWGRCP